MDRLTNLYTYVTGRKKFHPSLHGRVKCCEPEGFTTAKKPTVMLRTEPWVCTNIYGDSRVMLNRSTY